MNPHSIIAHLGIAYLGVVLLALSTVLVYLALRGQK